MLMKKMLEKILRPQANLQKFRAGMALHLKVRKNMYIQLSRLIILLT